MKLRGTGGQRVSGIGDGGQIFENDVQQLGCVLRLLARLGDDNGDWSVARAADTYDAYMVYLKAHPQGRHAAEARREAAAVRPIANALPQEPPIGQLAPGATVVVDDHSCKRGEIKVITGGNVVTDKIVRTRKCVPRDQLP